MHQNQLTTPNKIVHYSAIFSVNMSKLSVRLFELFTRKTNII